MSEDNQAFIPDSFMALYVDPGRYKPRIGRAEMIRRYELCEDMANMLMDTASTQQFDLGITPDDVLERCHRGLQGTPALVTEEESVWVICRLAELLNWPSPKLK
ncbi:MAG: ATPase with chaperone activity [Betaproteobacteria bacterium]|jgi:hypothetical protein|nr:ATPase with chaperone activity [Burkholderiales bacterium]NBX14381.1 ATPase with chaperone activity [Betaproteobacteria bacterium]NBX90472.1 ATPase with chaperone activity [Betaproteobacteria bacterium]